jgi:hypothetical protein
MGAACHYPSQGLPITEISLSYQDHIGSLQDAGIEIARDARPVFVDP